MNFLRTLSFTWLLLLTQWMHAGEHCNFCSKSKSHQVQDTYVRDSALLAYDVGFYWIDIETSDASTFVKGYTLVQGRALKTISELVFELSGDLWVDSVFVDGKGE